MSKVKLMRKSKHHLIAFMMLVMLNVHEKSGILIYASVIKFNQIFCTFLVKFAVILAVCKMIAL